MEPIISILSAVFLSLFILFFPWFAIRLAKKVKIIGILGPVSICYLAGILLGNLTPAGWLSKSVPLTFADVTIPLAIPLLLSSTDFRKGFGEAKLALFSFFLSAISVAISSAFAGYYYSGIHFESAQIASMLSGMYTGGTPNLNAVGMALGAGKETIALVNTVDIVIGGLYLLFLLTIGKKFFSLFLKQEKTGVLIHRATQKNSVNASLRISVQERGVEFSESDRATQKNSVNASLRINVQERGVEFSESDRATQKNSVNASLRINVQERGVEFTEPESEIQIPKIDWKSSILPNGIGLLLAILGFGVSIAFTFLIFSSLYAPSILLGITTWGIGISFYSKVRELKTYEFGSYLILVFSVAIGFLANLEELKRDFGSVLLILTSILFGAILLHLILGIFFRIPVDTWIITSVSSIYGPAFVPPVVQAIKNRGVLVVGILTGLIGYAIGNYLGIGLYSFLNWIRS
ncbi:DUF819 family protein [Leptospira sp. WS92.C1]